MRGAGGSDLVEIGCDGGGGGGVCLWLGVVPNHVMGWMETLSNQLPASLRWGDGCFPSDYQPKIASADPGAGAGGSGIWPCIVGGGSWVQRLISWIQGGVCSGWNFGTSQSALHEPADSHNKCIFDIKQKIFSVKRQSVHLDSTHCMLN